MRKLLFSLIVIVLAASCNKQEQLSATYDYCQLESYYPVRFTGQAFGYGEITLSPLDDGQKGISFQIILKNHAEAAAEPMIKIKGVGQCVNGVVKGQFGSGVSYQPTVKVLGGGFVGAFKHANIDEPFGKWNIALFDAQNDKRFDLKGFWEYSVKNTQK